jgi:phage terminase Nu1 subunit (DNA packaging protein)
MNQTSDEIEFNAKALAALFAVTERSISEWTKEGMPFLRVKEKVNRYQWHPCFRWYLMNKYTGTTASRGNRPPSKAESDAKLTDIKAKREEMKLNKDLANLLPADQIQSAWTEAATIAKDRVLGIPTAAKLQIPDLTKEDLEKLRKICHDTLETLSQCPTQPSSE